MRLSSITYAAALLLSATVLSAGVARAGDVQVRVSPVGSARGVVRAEVCRANEWLKDGCQLTGMAPARPGTTVVTIRNVPPGVWAVVAFHDKDESGLVARNVLGIPTEGVGFSENPSLGLHGPRFGDSAFRLGPDGGVVDVRLHFE